MDVLLFYLLQCYNGADIIFFLLNKYNFLLLYLLLLISHTNDVGMVVVRACLFLDVTGKFLLDQMDVVS